MNLLTVAVRAAAAACALTLIAPSYMATPSRAAAPARGDLGRFLSRYHLLALDPDAVRAEVRATGRFTLETPEVTFEVALSPHDLRSASYRAQDTGAGGVTRTVDKRRPATKTFAGSAVGVVGSSARFTLDEGKLTGLILTPGEWYYVEPLSNYSAAGGPADYVFYRGSDVNMAEAGTCATSLAEKVASAADGVAGKAAETAAVQNRMIQLATEADYEFVNALGGAANANTEILSVMNQVEGVYQNEVGLAFEVVYQHTWSANNDPYSSTAASAMLDEFRNHWNSSFTGVQRDIAHLWTGRDMDGSTIGIAYTGIVCANGSYSYGISQRYTVQPGKYILTAHEIGHNFSASHSDAQSGCTNTIMGSSVGSGFTFCTFSRGEINTWVSGHSSCLPLVPTSTLGAYNPVVGVFFLKNGNTPGAADMSFPYGPANAGWTPLSGDWDGNGTNTVGLYDPATGNFFLKNSNGAGPADMTFQYGAANSGWVPLAGDWDGDGDDTVGLYNPTAGWFYLRNTNAGGPADLTFSFGPGGQGWRPLSGDWDGDGDDTVGAYSPSNGFFFLRNANSAGAADLQFGYGPPGVTPVAGDWSGLGRDTVGVYVNGFYYLRNSNTPGVADITVNFGVAGLTPVMGDWDGQ
jgi:hypothetical protein